jgi:hypothetical protein
MSVILLNIVVLLVTYALLCNVSYSEKTMRSDGTYTLKRGCVIPDKIPVNKNFKTVLAIVLLLLFPMTHVLCYIIWGVVVVGYLSGGLEVFGKSNGENLEN